MTVGGDKLNYPNEIALPATSLIETKLIINSVISNHAKHKSRFCAIDLKDFFLKKRFINPNIYAFILNIYLPHLRIT